MSRRHLEHHHVGNVGWLRAAVLGADDGLLSTASLIIGVAAAQPSRGAILIAGAAGLLAGSMSMAAGEYVSVSSQHDAETADLKREAAELEADPKAEVSELTAIYIARGLDPALASQVAEQLMVKDALGAHARDELGISEITRARPLQAAFASAASFAVGAAAPLVLAASTPLGCPYPVHRDRHARLPGDARRRRRPRRRLPDDQSRPASDLLGCSRNVCHGGPRARIWLDHLITPRRNCDGGHCQAGGR